MEAIKVIKAITYGNLQHLASNLQQLMMFSEQFISNSPQTAANHRKLPKLRLKRVT